MVSCVPKSKHVKLTLACYPKSKTAAPHPNSSELQYLAYYASSRPKKLIKVGLYIRNKVVKDVYWNKQTDVIVSIDICTALVEKCHANLNLFANDVVQVLNAAFALANKDALILEHAATCFTSLVRYLKESLLASDPLFSQHYQETLLALAKAASLYYSEDDWQSTKMCLDAVQAACQSKAISAINADSQIAALVPPALDILHSATEEVLYAIRASSRSADASKHERRPSFMTPAMNRPQANTLQSDSNGDAVRNQVLVPALQVLRILFETNDASQIRNATNVLLSFFRTRGKSENGWASTLVQFAAEWTPINLRFHILSLCLRELVDFQYQSWPETHQSVLLYLVHGLLTSKVSLIGLSTIDVLETLLTFAESLLQATEAQNADIMMQNFHLVRGESIARASNIKADYLARFVRTAGSISAHTYYEDQVSDLCRTILAHLGTRKADKTASYPLIQFVGLEILSLLMRTARPATVPGEAQQRIPLDQWIDTFHLLGQDNRYLRLELVDVVLQYLDSSFFEPVSRSGGLLYQEYNMKQIQLAIFSGASMCSQNCEEALAWFLFTKSLVQKLDPESVAGFIPMLYHVVTQNVMETRLSSALITLILHSAVDRYGDSASSQLLEVNNALFVFKAIFTVGDLDRQNITDLVQSAPTPLAISTLALPQVSLPPAKLVIASLRDSDGLSAEPCPGDIQWDPSTHNLPSNDQQILHESQQSARELTMSASRASVEPSSATVSGSLHAGRVNNLKLALSSADHDQTLERLKGQSHVDVKHLFDGIELEALPTQK